MRSFNNHDTESLRGFLHLDFAFPKITFKFLTVKDLKESPKKNQNQKIFDMN